MEADGVDEVTERRHIVGRQFRSAHQRVERVIESREVFPVASPVQWLEMVEAAQRLRRHRPFHRMQLERARRAHHRLHRSAGVSQVPRQHVHIGIDVARRTRRRPIARQLGVIEKSPAAADDIRCRVKRTDVHCIYGNIGPRQNDGDGVRDAIQHVQQRNASVHRQPAWAAIAARVDYCARCGSDFDS